MINLRLLGICINNLLLTPKNTLMKPDFYVVQVKVYTTEMITFYRNDPDSGTKEKPFKADFFSELISPYAIFYGPLRNILLFRANSIYQWKLESSDGRPLTFSKATGSSELEIEMISNAPSEKKWKKVFKNAPAMQADGKIKVKSKEANQNVYELETSNDIEGGSPVKYSFLFEFDDEKGITKYAIIDPFGDVFPPPPPSNI